jgi:hypothetical protein
MVLVPVARRAIVNVQPGANMVVRGLNQAQVLIFRQISRAVSGAACRGNLFVTAALHIPPVEPWAMRNEDERDEDH